MDLPFLPFPVVWDSYLIAALATGAIGLLLFVTIKWGRKIPIHRSLREKVRRAAAARAKEGIDDRENHWLLPAERVGDRRQTVRRSGPVTPIRVTTAPNANPVKTVEGLVVDRTSRGLCIASEHTYEVGTTIYVLAIAAVPDIPWVAATVRNCRERGDHVLIGCEFVKAPPWNILLLFG